MDRIMKIESAHKILIGAAIAFFAFLAWREGARFAGSGEPSAGLLAVGGLAAAGVLAAYLRWYVRSLRNVSSSGDHSPARRPADREDR
jgi:hypothetical protein